MYQSTGNEAISDIIPKIYNPHIPNPSLFEECEFFDDDVLFEPECVEPEPECVEPESECVEPELECVEPELECVEPELECPPPPLECPPFNIMF